MDASKLLRTLAYGKGAILTPHIDLFLEGAEFPEEWTIKIRNRKEDDGHFHPSGHCLMEVPDLVKDRLAAEREKISATLRKTFDCGHMWHGYLQEILTEMGFVAPENVERHEITSLDVLRERLMPGIEPSGGYVSGTIDLWDVEVPSHGRWLVDIKTTSSRNFDSLETTSLYQKYVAQVNVYGDMMRAKQMMILVVEKDTPHRFREIVVKRDDNLLYQIYTRWAEAAQLIAQKVS